MKRVVITGIGMATPLGSCKDTFWLALLQSRIAIGPISVITPVQGAHGMRSGAEVKDLEALGFPGKRTLWNISRSIKLGYAAADASLKDAGIDSESTLRERIGVVFGSTLGGLGPLLDMERQAAQQGPRYVDPSLFPSAGPSAPGCQVSITGNMPTLNTTVSNGQTSGLDAIHYASRQIQLGRVDAALAGAVEEISPEIFTTCEEAMLLAGSRPGTDPACRPFDARRSGFVPGEGAACVLLEDLASARARNAHIYAEVTGYSFCFWPRACRRNEAAARAMSQALRVAGVEADSIGAVFASANGSLAGDLAEAKGIHQMFGEHGAPVIAIKGMLGESYSAAGLIQTVIGVLSLENKVAPSSCGCEVPDPHMPKIAIAQKPVPLAHSSVLINAFGRSGGHASLVLQA